MQHSFGSGYGIDNNRLIFDDVGFLSVALRAFKGTNFPAPAIRFYARQLQRAAAFDAMRPLNARR